ncbi:MULTISPECIES: chaplin [unclassified Streptomyces]|uniref:chaplin n=1 Tax=unclassified Streptomyces TaxID=2593676 RepID=UPI002DDC7116|nr:MULTISPECIES: chaplin [unclassified Streptomyces]WSA96730.1 chaplin [Streptomyces sp. NBC_01795]WSB81146.1 chaplin [Streptomyces sp. NBC_01775]WSS10645.1 chaplin [Streptomyces sp. NBC_01186]WSS39339.1 chaplin [Streptomyces sp. NBC_01187]
MRIRTAIAAGALSAALLGATAGTAVADDGPKAHTGHSPGVLSGNNVQVPVHIPVNVCGNTIIGLLNSTSHNHCTNK